MYGQREKLYISFKIYGQKIHDLIGNIKQT